MIKDFKNIVKHSSIYTVGNILTKAIGIILIPLYTKYIPVESFAVYSLFFVSSEFLVAILLLGLGQASIRWFSMKPDKQGSLLFTLICYCIGSLMVLSLLAGMFRYDLSMIFFKDVQYSSLFLLTALIIGLTNIDNILSVYLRVQERSVLFILSKVLNFLIQLVVTIYLIVVLKTGITGIFIGRIAGVFIAILVKLVSMAKELTLKLDISELKGMILYGYPLSFSGISNKILDMGDRYILSILTNMTVVGCYSLGYKFANLIKTLFINSFFTAFRPLMWKKNKDENVKRFHAKMLTYYLFIIMWISLFIAVYAKGIIHNFALNKDYWQAYKIVGIVVFSISIKGTFQILRVGLEFTDKTKYVPLIITSAGIINIALNFLLIPHLEMMGAALATLLSFLYMIVIAYVIVNKLYPVHFEWRKIILILGTSLSLYIVSRLFDPFSLSLRITGKLFLLLLYPLILYFFHFFEDVEIRRIKGAWKKWRDPRKWKDNTKDINFR